MKMKNNNGWEYEILETSKNYSLLCREDDKQYIVVYGINKEKTSWAYSLGYFEGIGRYLNASKKYKEVVEND